MIRNIIDVRRTLFCRLIIQAPNEVHIYIYKFLPSQDGYGGKHRGLNIHVSGSATFRSFLPVVFHKTPVMNCNVMPHGKF